MKGERKELSIWEEGGQKAIKLRCLWGKKINMGYESFSIRLDGETSQQFKKNI